MGLGDNTTPSSGQTRKGNPTIENNFDHFYPYLLFSLSLPDDDHHGNHRRHMCRCCL